MATKMGNIPKKKTFFFTSSLREAVKNYLADFSVKGGGHPPFRLAFLGTMTFR